MAKRLKTCMLLSRSSLWYPSNLQTWVEFLYFAERIFFIYKQHYIRNQTQFWVICQFENTSKIITRRNQQSKFWVNTHDYSYWWDIFQCIRNMIQHIKYYNTILIETFFFFFFRVSSQLSSYGPTSKQKGEVWALRLRVGEGS